VPAAGTWRDLAHAPIRLFCLAGCAFGLKSTKKENIGLRLMALPRLLSDCSAWGSCSQLERVHRCVEVLGSVRVGDALGWGSSVGVRVGTTEPLPAPSLPDAAPHHLGSGHRGQIQHLLLQQQTRRGGEGLSSPEQMQDRSRQGPPAGTASTARPAARGNLPVVQRAGALQGSSWLLRHL